MQFSKQALFLVAALSMTYLQGTVAQQVIVTFGQVDNDLFIEWSGSITQLPNGTSVADLFGTSNRPGIDSSANDNGGNIEVTSGDIEPGGLFLQPDNGVTFSGDYRVHTIQAPDVQGDNNSTITIGRFDTNQGFLAVPLNYVLGNPIQGCLLYKNETFASANMLDGQTLAATWTAGGVTQSISFNYDAAVAPTALSASCVPNIPPVTGGGMGDPHIKLWNGTIYDFHGECELVLHESKSFADGLGMSVHLRTMMQDDWSFIESVAIKIGKDILEISSRGSFLLNGIKATKLPKHFADLFSVSYRAADPSKRTVGCRWHVFKIDLHNGQELFVKSFASQKLLSVIVKGTKTNDFGDSRGLMGAFRTGARLGRDGVTVLDDDNEFGQEWQVRPGQDYPTSLFHQPAAPQWPQQCILPLTKSSVAAKELRALRGGGRRLGHALTEEDASAACADWTSDERDLCIFDVMAAGDLSLAEAGSY